MNRLKYRFMFATQIFWLLTLFTLFYFMIELSNIHFEFQSWPLKLMNGSGLTRMNLAVTCMVLFHMFFSVKLNSLAWRFDFDFDDIYKVYSRLTCIVSVIFLTLTLTLIYKVDLSKEEIVLDNSTVMGYKNFSISQKIEVVANYFRANNADVPTTIIEKLARSSRFPSEAIEMAAKVAPDYQIPIDLPIEDFLTQFKHLMSSMDPTTFYIVNGAIFIFCLFALYNKPVASPGKPPVFEGWYWF